MLFICLETCISIILRQESTLKSELAQALGEGYEINDRFVTCRTADDILNGRKVDTVNPLEEIATMVKNRQDATHCVVIRVSPYDNLPWSKTVEILDQVMKIDPTFRYPAHFIFDLSIFDLNLTNFEQYFIQYCHKMCKSS